jgi:Mg-chelatase subunit ChlD
MEITSGSGVVASISGSGRGDWEGLELRWRRSTQEAQLRGRKKSVRAALLTLRVLVAGTCCMVAFPASAAVDRSPPGVKVGASGPHGSSVLGTESFAQATSEDTSAGSPHLRLGGLEVTFARRVGDDHRPTEPTKKFSEADRAIFMAFRNSGSEQVRADINVYAVDVEGVEPNTRIWSNAWVQLPPGEGYSLRLDGPDEGLLPGTYRFQIDAGGQRQTSMVEVAPLYPPALGEEDTELAPGYNIALDALGGQIEQASQWDDGAWSMRHLNDGLSWVAHPVEHDRCINCGWLSREGDRRATIVLSFYQHREAQIAAVVVDTRAFRSGNQSDEQFAAALPKDVAVHVSSESATRDFERVATARLHPSAERQIILLPPGTRGKYLKLEVLGTFGANVVAMAELEVIEADSREHSIVEGAEIDLANVALGGTLVRYTGYADGKSAANLFDPDDRGTSWRSYDQYFPQDFTIAFKDDQVALVDRVRVSLPPGEGAASWPSEVAISLSQHSPVDGFEEVGRFTVEQRPGPQEFVIHREARFVKVRLLGNHGAGQTSMAELAVIEGLRDGYVPLLLRGAPTPRTAVSTQEEQTTEGDAVAEVEPNDEPRTANALKLGGTTRGEINPLGEVDFFALPDLGPDASALTVNYSGRPYIRHGLSLLDEGGLVISHFDPGDLPASNARLTFALAGNPRYLKLSEPPASVVVIWDTSGSMRGSEQDLERAVREYIRRAPSSQRMNLIRFSNDVEPLLPDFTSDKARLETVLAGKFRAEGGTRLYDAILEGMRLLAGQQGNRAMVVMTDGEDNGKTWHDAFWRRIEQNRVRLYTIGLGSGLGNYSYQYATTGGRILRHLSLASDGHSFFAAESGALQEFYGRIADELSRPAAYLLQPVVERGFGTLRLVATAEQVPSAAMPAVHIIYDLSGSMLERGPGGQPKYVLAQKAIYSALDDLPDGAPFGFTVYGARIPERAGKDKACTDIATLQALAPLNKQAVRDFVARQKPRGGTTPLARSVQHVAQNFAGKNGGIIIAVTDGIEECDPDPVATIDALKHGQMQYLELDVVGFALKDPDARKMMETIAEVGGGRYFDATDAESLAQALKEAMAAKYTVHDAAGRMVTSGTIDGGAATMPAGFYRVDIAAADGPIRTRDVRISQDHETVVRVNKVGSEVDVSVEEPRSLARMRQARRDCGAAAAARDSAERARRVQDKLNQLGFDVGTADNHAGPRTRQGIGAFQQRFGLPVSGEVTLVLEQHLDCVIAIGQVFLPEGGPEAGR